MRTILNGKVLRGGVEREDILGGGGLGSLTQVKVMKPHKRASDSTHKGRTSTSLHKS